MEYNFFAMISRMKYIDRWALMRNTREENLCEHSLEVSIIAHALAVIGNTYYEKDLNAERAALIGLYHDASEIITGDMLRDSYNKAKRLLSAHMAALDSIASFLIEHETITGKEFMSILAQVEPQR